MLTLVKSPLHPVVESGARDARLSNVVVRPRRVLRNGDRLVSVGVTAGSPMISVGDTVTVGAYGDLWLTVKSFSEDGTAVVLFGFSTIRNVSIADLTVIR